MTLSPGTRLGVYEVTAQIGAGGMGVVYRARDTRLDREVALKILPELFISDPQRVARFQREAKTLAALNHPNIGAIHGVEEANGLAALILELVEGTTLADRIAQGPVPLDEALPIAKQIAHALEAAHETGIIHRDLKPGNVKLRPDGAVKVLDFGLAKAMEPVDGAANVSHSPVITTPAVTQAGSILGTAAYMSPEQARGKPVDKRADIWAFGVVVFEMLTGDRLFTGATISDTLASVLKTDPNWRALPPAVSPRLRELLRRCLDKDPKRRLRDIGDARVQIEDLLAGAPEETGAAMIAGTLPTWQRVVPWVATGFLAAGFVVVLLLLATWPKASPLAPVRLSTELGADVSLTIGPGAAMSLSAAGDSVAFVAQRNEGGSPQIYVRPLTQLKAMPLPGTDDAESPFFSPDGHWIGFFAGGKLKKVAATGGVAITLCDAPNGRGGAWSEDGTIIFEPDSAPGRHLMRVSSDGGMPGQVTPLAEGEASQRWPQVLPGGKAVLFTGSRAIRAYDDAYLVVQPLPTGARTIVQREAYHGRYLPSGHLVYIHDGTLFGAPFDLDRLAVTGPSVPVLESVETSAATGGAQFAVSGSGTLVYLPSQGTGGELPIHWMDHEGKTTPLRVARANWLNLLFAPDGRRLALQIGEGQLADIWVYEWARDTLTRLTFDPADDAKPVWTPDGRRIVFASARGDKSTLNVYWQRTDGTGDAHRLTESKNPQRPASWHPNGKFLAFEELNPTTNWDLMILPMEGNEASGWKPGKPTVFLNSPFQDREPMFSPDGRWLAYVSNETGRSEVYVRPFPGPGGKWQISSGGGYSPTWSRTTRQLLYSVNGRLMAARFSVAGDSFRAENPGLWSTTRFAMRGVVTRMFDLHPDGDRVALAPIEQVQSGAKQDHVTFIFNFFDELRRVASVTKR